MRKTIELTLCHQVKIIEKSLSVRKSLYLIPKVLMIPFEPVLIIGVYILLPVLPGIIDNLFN
jgi:hypothetical protein